MKNFLVLLQAVSSVSDIDADTICSHSREQDIVAARHALIILLYRDGQRSSTIARHLHLTKRCVNYVLSAPNSSVSTDVRYLVEQAEKRLRNSKEIQS